MTTITAPHSHHSDFEPAGDTAISDPHYSRASSPSTTPSSYASSKDENTHLHVPTTTTTPRGSTQGLTSTPEKPTSTMEPHFFGLPRELREKIYIYALSTPHPVAWPSTTLHAHLAPQLLRTCRTIHNEATPVLYSQNRFQFHHPSDANMFLYNHNPDTIRANVKRLSLLIKDREVTNLWTFWLSSTMANRSLAGDYPNLTRIDIRLRSTFLRELNGDLVDRFKLWQGDRALRRVCFHTHERVGPQCVVHVVAQTRLASADIRMLMEGFPGELIRSGVREKYVVFTSRPAEIDGCRALVEIEATPESRGP